MAFTISELERIAAWCDTSTELASARSAGWEAFFGTDKEGPADYQAEVGEYTSRHRRFLGWFLFQSTLSTGEHPAGFAARQLLEGEQRSVALRALAQARYVMAIVSAAIPGRGVILELEEERFEVRSREWAQLMRRDALVLAHLVPTRPDVWLPAPGWLEWTVAVGPNIRRELRGLQTDPISTERVLQGRERRSNGQVVPPHDATLTEAVARMTEAATRAGRSGLVRTEEEWAAVVVRHMQNPDITAFSREVVEWTGELEDVRELNLWLALAQNIWNATPQPDREGRTAYELGAESPPRDLKIDAD